VIQERKNVSTSWENLWLDASYEAGPALSGEHEADIAIVGGGFTGLATAYFVKQLFPQKRVVVLESEFVGFGSSGRNTGISGATLGHSLLRLQKKHGTEPVARLQQLSLQSFLLVEELIKKHHIDCDYERNGLLLVAENEKQLRLLEKEAKACEEVGAKAAWLDGNAARSMFGGLDVLAGLHHAEQATLNPARFARGMKRVVESLGVEVYESSRCTRIECGRTARLQTPGGAVRAPVVVMATNAYSNPLGLMRRKVVPFYVYNIATEPLKKAQMDAFGWPKRPTVFNMKHMFWVIRLTADNRVVFINNDALYFYDVDRDYSHRPRQYQNHYELLVRMFPFLNGIKMTHHWGGRIGMTLSFLPCVGRGGEHGNIYYSMGYNGHGVAFSQMAGKMLAALIAGEDSELTSNMLINKAVPGIPTALFSYLGINGYKMMYRIDDWLLS